jgi:hypothetical protein
VDNQPQENPHIVEDSFSLHETKDKTISFVKGIARGTINAWVGLCEGSITSAEKATHLDGKPKTTLEKLEKGAITAGYVAGGVIGSTIGGIPGYLIGTLVGPGVVGGTIEAGRGAVEGAKIGVKESEKFGEKAEAFVTKHFGESAGKFTGLLAPSLVALGLVPCSALSNALVRGVKFGMNAGGLLTEDGKLKKGLDNTFGQSTVGLSGVAGGVYAAAGTATALIPKLGFLGAYLPMLAAASFGSAAAAGGFSTLAAGVAKGCERFKEGYDLEMDKFAKEQPQKLEQENTGILGAIA